MNQKAVGPLLLLLVLSTNALAQTDDGLSEVQRLEQQIAIQRDVLADLSDSTGAQQERIDELEKRIRDLQDQIDQLDTGGAQDTTTSSLAERLERLEATVDAGSDPEAPSRGDDDGEFQGSFRVPGTDVRIRFGGFVKMSIVESFDPIESSNRFVTAEIPPEGQAPPGSGARISLTANQSRVSLDFRQPTKSGTLRAFVEGDFAGSGNTFRLRHAYGQFRDLLAGQTWSTFVDVAARPEEIDFEGLNARIRIRQAQVRYFPRIGRKMNLALAIEDPQPSVTGGTGVSQIPDFVAQIHRTVSRGHVQFSLLLRQIRAQPDVDPNIIAGAFGWGTSLSGQIPVDWWEGDNFQFQVNVGEGIGRYINDLGSAGGQDAVFDSTNQLVSLPAYAGYVAYQHWWTTKLRSTVDYGAVFVNNRDFQSGGSYRFTQRLAGNLMFSPITRIDLGVELLWGERQNFDRTRGYATQLQLAMKYRF